MAWFYLLLAGMCEMVWPLGFKYTNGFTTRYWAVAITFAVMIASFGLMSLASRTLPVGTVYAVWTGMGAAGIAILGMILFKEPAEIWRLTCLSLIVLGVIGLKIGTKIAA